MDVDPVKTSASDSSNSMDMMAMMMQMEKFPEFYEPFYNTTYQENELISGGTSSTSISTTMPPIFAPPSLLDPPPSNVHIINNNNNNTIHQPMTTLPLQQTLNPSGRFRNNNIPNASSFPYPSSSSEKGNSMAAMREMIFRIAVMQPIHIDPESIKPPKRRNVKISKDPQSVAARHRRERISERIRILQRLVPGGTKMDTASMLDEAIHYVKFLKKQVQTLEQAGGVSRSTLSGGVVGFPSLGMSNANVSYSSLLMKGCQPANCHMVGSTCKQLFS